MAFNIDNWDKLSSAAKPGLPTEWGYRSNSETLTQISVSGYFNEKDNQLNIGDYIYIAGSDGVTIYGVTAISPNVTIASNPDIVTPNSIVNADINASAAIAYSKLAALTSGHTLIGSAGNVATDTAISQDFTLDNTGAATLANNVVTSSKLAKSILQYTTLTITSNQFKGMYDAPIAILPAPGVGFAYVPTGLTLIMTYGAATYTGGGNTGFTYGNTIRLGGPQVALTKANTVFNVAQSIFTSFNPYGVSTNLAQCDNIGIYLTNASAAYATGDSNFVCHAWYRVVPTV